MHSRSLTHNAVWPPQKVSDAAAHMLSDRVHLWCSCCAGRKASGGACTPAGPDWPPRAEGQAADCMSQTASCARTRGRAALALKVKLVHKLLWGEAARAGAAGPEGCVSAQGPDGLLELRGTGHAVSWVDSPASGAWEAGVYRDRKIKTLWASKQTRSQVSVARQAACTRLEVDEVADPRQQGDLKGQPADRACDRQQQHHHRAPSQGCVALPWLADGLRCQKCTV